MADDAISSHPVAHHPLPGVVVANYGGCLDVETDDGTIRRCTARRRIGALVCGDRVIWQEGPCCSGVVEQLLPRHTLLARTDSQGRPKPLAANVDNIVVVASPSPGIDEDLIDHYLVAAEHTGITPILLINKRDLLTDQALLRQRRRLSVYTDIGYRLIFASTKQQCGLDELIRAIRGRNTVFCGESGVGKSSLINALLPGIDARVAELSAASGKGVHTTTTARLYRLPQGGAVIDSPGVREFGLGKMAVAEISDAFVEFRKYAEKCRFRDCTHRAEPGCAVVAACEQGRISARRLESYRHMVVSFADC